MNSARYIHQDFWDSMHDRIVTAVMYFEPFVYDPEIAAAFRSELFLLRAVVGEARLQFGQLPPASPFMRLFQRVIIEDQSGGWSELRGAATSYMADHGPDAPPDRTQLAKWWEAYGSDCLVGDRAALHQREFKWRAAEFVVQASGRELGIPANSPPEGNLAAFLADIYMIDSRVFALQKHHAAQLLELSTLERMLADDLVQYAKDMGRDEVL
ncbi:hypothetical protein PENSPDRAFT_695359 [Peniophora sp. CONT]|nr:hypothetical protein PENSPDRAFT_695359 [Peniophora sp. CONT]